MVLTTARRPAVLVEMGYSTNPADARLLTNKDIAAAHGVGDRRRRRRVPRGLRAEDGRRLVRRVLLAARPRCCRAAPPSTRTTRPTSTPMRRAGSTARAAHSRPAATGGAHRSRRSRCWCTAPTASMRQVRSPYAARPMRPWVSAVRRAKVLPPAIERLKNEAEPRAGHPGPWHTVQLRLGSPDLASSTVAPVTESKDETAGGRRSSCSGSR